MPETWSPVLVLVVGAAVFLYGLSKTAMPVAGVLAGPVLAAALTATSASAFAVPLLILGDLFALALYRQHADWSLIRRLIPGVLLGIVITAILFRFLDVHTIGRIVGVLILTSVLLEVWRSRSERADHRELPALESKAAIAFFGALAGVTSMAANAGGTAMTLYLVKMRVSMLAFMGTSTWFFFVINVIKVPIVVALGLVTRETLLADLWFAPMIVVGAVMGIFVFRRMNQHVFTTVALTLSAIASVWLIIHG
jgi:uncharacterized membrane protein YfcA